MYLYDLDKNDKFSYLLFKKPGSVYAKDNVEGKYESDTCYRIFVKLDTLNMIHTLKSINSESYNTYQHEGVTPFSLNKGFDVIRSALRGDYDANSEEEKTLATTPHSYAMHIGPFINDPEQVKESFEFVGYKVSMRETENKVAHSYIIVGNDTLSTFLQKVFIISLHLTSYYTLYPLQDSQIQKYITLSSSWFNLKNDFFKKVIRNICKNNKSFMNIFIEGVSDEEEEQVEAKDKLYINFKTLHKARHTAIAEAVIDLNTSSQEVSIVDLGCSEGRLSLKVNDALITKGVPFHVYSYDVKDKFYNIAKKVRNLTFNKMNILYPNPNKVPAKTDILLLSEVIEHFEREDRLKLLSNICNVFNPTSIIISTPNVRCNESLGVPPNTFREKSHKIEFSPEGYTDEIHNFLTNCGYERRYTINFRKEGDEWVYSKDPTISVDSPTIMVAYVKTPCVASDKKEVITTHDSFYLPICNFDITQKELQNGYAERAFTENGKNIFYVAPTVPPVDYYDDPDDPDVKNFLEHPSSVFKYYKERGITELVCERKYMGSRAHILLFKNIEIANKFGFDETIVINTRNGNKFFMEKETNDKFYADVVDKLMYDVTVLDAEMMPWSVKAGRLIRDKFVGVGETNLINRLTQDDINYSNAEAYMNALKPYTKEEEPYAVIFGVLGVANKAGKDFDWILGSQIDNVDKHRYIRPLTGKMFREVEFTYVNLNDPSSMRDEIFDWESYCANGGEGKVYKPIDTVNYSPSGYLIQPMMKVRGRNYLRIIYGMDYLEPEIFEIVKKRGTNKKRLQAILETELSNLIFTAFTHNRKELRMKFVAGILGNETVNFSNVDKTL